MSKAKKQAYADKEKAAAAAAANRKLDQLADSSSAAPAPKKPGRKQSRGK